MIKPEDYKRMVMQVGDTLNTYNLDINRFIRDLSTYMSFNTSCALLKPKDADKL